MDFDSPDVEKDFPGLYASESGVGKRKDEDSEPDHDKLSKKDLLIGRKKDKKDRGYAALEGESSPEEEIDAKSPYKSGKKPKPFKFSSKNKEKREKSREKDKIDKDVKEKFIEPKDKRKEKEKKDKLKDKDKDKKEKKIKQTGISEETLELGDVHPVFGVSINMAIERSRCHDGINLPLVVRDCIDYLQENGLQSEQIYKVQPLKSKVQYLKKLYNNRESGTIEELDIPLACGLLQLFLRELPEPILTTDLIGRFEETISQTKTIQEKDLSNLLEQLPRSNRMLLSWLIVHFDCVIKNEKLNKMNIQSLAVILSPTLQMPHRLLTTFITLSSKLFPNVKLIKYIPPITSTSPNLPENRDELYVELRKQESLLTQIHSEMSTGFVSKKREEQLWEVQRIITQLKRKIKTFDKKWETCLKESEDNTDGDMQNQTKTTIKLKLSSSDDESLKTLTTPAKESVINTEIKENPQGSCVSPSNIGKDTIILHSEQNLLNSSIDKNQTNDMDLIMVPETHPEYINLIRLQLENQELMLWKSQLQARIKTERAELLHLKKVLELSESNSKESLNSKKKLPVLDSEDLDHNRIIEHYIKENNLLEQKKNMLVKKMFEERKELVQLQVELALQAFKV